VRRLFLLPQEFYICKNAERCEDALATVRDVAGTVTKVCKKRTGECLGPYMVLVSEELDPSTTGFLAELSAALAEAGVPVMVYSSVERDYILIPLESLKKALGALKHRGFEVFWEDLPGDLGA